MSLVSLRFPCDALEREFCTQFHRSWHGSDRRWLLLHVAILLALVARICSSVGSRESALLAVLMLPRAALLSLSYTHASARWGRVRPWAITGYRLWGAAAVIIALLSNMGRLPCPFQRASIADVIAGEIIHAAATVMPFKHHVPLALAVVATKVLLTLFPGIGLCAVVEAKAAQGHDHCTRTLRALRAVHTWTSAAVRATVTGGVREPKSACSAVAAFYAVAVGFFLPTALLYLRERSERRAFLISRGLMPHAWLAAAPVEPLLLVPMALLCLLTVYPLLTVAL